MRTCFGGLLAIVLLFLSACRTALPELPAEVEACELIDVTVGIGRILKVNEALRYVVVDCVSLPSRGEAAIVYDGDRPVGRLLITGPIRSPFVVADITDGAVMTGNTVKVVKKRRAQAAQEKGSK